MQIPFRTQRRWTQPLRFSCAVVASSLLASCAGPSAYSYHFVPGRTAVVSNGYAMPPAGAPGPVVEAIAAGNRIAGLPYRYGGGHASFTDSAYDCSGSASYVLHGAGLLGSPMPSTGFRHYGESGPGRWISVYARHDHTFLVIAGLRFDTGYGDTRGSGPRWSDRDRTTRGAVVRHPRGW